MRCTPADLPPLRYMHYVCLNGDTLQRYTATTGFAGISTDAALPLSKAASVLSRVLYLPFTHSYVLLRTFYFLLSFYVLLTVYFLFPYVLLTF